jgi:hypothetical protein
MTDVEMIDSRVKDILEQQEGDYQGTKLKADLKK